VLTTAADANIGSIFGIGFPAWTGGALQFIESEAANGSSPTRRYWRSAMVRASRCRRPCGDAVERLPQRQ
jgi:hypothetical protein